jgi:ParB family chromosome partitioning protein
MPEGLGTWDQLLSVTQAKLNNQAIERRRVPIDQLVPNPEQPRRHFDDIALHDLTNSVRLHGILQPLLVRPAPADKRRFQIVAGERRYRAAKEAGLTELPVVVRELDDREALELGLVENLLREDVTVLEEARALQKLLDNFGYSYAQLGERLGKNKAYVDHRVRLLKMPTDIQDALERDALAQVAAQRQGDARAKKVFTPRHASVVVQIADSDERARLIARVFEENLTVADAQKCLSASKTTLKRVGSRNETVRKPHPDNTTTVPQIAVQGCATFRLFQRAQDGQVPRQALLNALQQDLKQLNEGLSDAGY